MSVEEQIRRLEWVVDFTTRFVKRHPRTPDQAIREAHADGFVHELSWGAIVAGPDVEGTEYGESMSVPPGVGDADGIREKLLAGALSALKGAGS